MSVAFTSLFAPRPLENGKMVSFRVERAPFSNLFRDALTMLWSEELEHSPIDRNAWLRGDYAGQLSMDALIAFVEGKPIATASVLYPRKFPEFSYVTHLVTLRDWRGQGLGSQVCDLTTRLSFHAGATVALLETDHWPDNLYQQIGYKRFNGSLMRRAEGAIEIPEEQFFAAGQATDFRSADWGDLPGVIGLVAQPNTTFCFDYQRSVYSGRYHSFRDGLRLFPELVARTREAGGDLYVLAGDLPNRVLGLGAVTPGRGLDAGRGTVDFGLHDEYSGEHRAFLAALIAEARQMELHTLQAYTAEIDEEKGKLYASMGFRRVGYAPEVYPGLEEKRGLLWWSRSL